MTWRISKIIICNSFRNLWFLLVKFAQSKKQTCHSSDRFVQIYGPFYTDASNEKPFLIIDYSVRDRCIKLQQAFLVVKWTDPEVIKLFSCSTQMRSKFILLINVKMPTVVGILTFISRINDWLLGFTSEISIDFGYFSTYEQIKFHAQLSWAWKKFYNLVPRT